MAIQTVKPRNFFLSKRRVKYKIILLLIFINFFFARDFADVHIQAQLEAQPGSSFHGEQGAQNLEINLLGKFIF